MYFGEDKGRKRGGKEKRDREDEMILCCVTIIEHSDIFVAYNEVKRLRYFRTFIFVQYVYISSLSFYK